MNHFSSSRSHPAPPNDLHIFEDGGHALNNNNANVGHAPLELDESTSFVISTSSHSENVPAPHDVTSGRGITPTRPLLAGNGGGGGNDVGDCGGRNSVYYRRNHPKIVKRGVAMHEDDPAHNVREWTKKGK